MYRTSEFNTLWSQNVLLNIYLLVHCELQPFVLSQPCSFWFWWWLDMVGEEWEVGERSGSALPTAAVSETPTITVMFSLTPTITVMLSSTPIIIAVFWWTPTITVMLSLTPIITAIICTTLLIMFQHRDHFKSHIRPRYLHKFLSIFILMISINPKTKSLTLRHVVTDILHSNLELPWCGFSQLKQWERATLWAQP